MSNQQEPILFLWGLSAWASKVTAYFALRGIPYIHCEQPITQPRPDIAALGVNYRRIPLLSLGRDIYCDSLLILEKLEQQYPASGKYKSISTTDPKDRALEKLLEKWTDVVVFRSAAAVISTDLDLMKDPKFQKDREELWGRSWTKEAQDALRPAALAEMRSNWQFLEDLLSDGREWVLGGKEGPMLADIHGECFIEMKRITQSPLTRVMYSMLDLRLATHAPWILSRRLFQHITISQRSRLARTLQDGDREGQRVGSQAH
jgi:glutathione S-transferase